MRVGKVSIRCCVRCRSPFGILRLLGLERRSRGVRPTRIQGSGFHGSPDPLRPGGGYFVPLSAALVASRKAVPTNVKDQPPRPFMGKTKSLYRTTTGDASGNLKLQSARIGCGILIWHTLSTNMQELIVPFCLHYQFAHGVTDAILCIFPVERNQHSRHGHRLGVDEI